MRLAIIVSPLLLAQPTESKPGAVEGTVVNAVTGEPIKKASVCLESQTKPGAEAHPPLTAQSDAKGISTSTLSNRAGTSAILICDFRRNATT
jgi:hypothetical protein